MAFGLYHSLENGVDQALRETLRVLKPGGILVITSARLDFDESLGRTEGYELNWIGGTLQRVLVNLFPRLFSNIVVVFARRPLDRK